MIISKIYGGLGNQLFQYALGRALAIKHNTELVLDISLLNNTPNHITYRKFELDKFCINASIATDDEIQKIKREHLKGICKSIYWRIQYLKPYYMQNYVKEKSFLFDEHIHKCRDNIYLDGYWQSPYYFTNIRDALLKDFILKNELTYKEFSYLESIKKSNSVSIHVRRGDYISNKKNIEIYKIIDTSYYKKAFNYIKNKNENISFYVFSDDLEWARVNIDSDNCIFIETENPTISLFLMSKCKHNIITNSTFSWWGAWLNNNPDKIVITPKEWFVTERLRTQDLLPVEWIQL